MDGRLVGREAEVGVIDAALAEPRDALGGPVELVIDGEAGIGKTTLWREAISRANGLGFRVLQCRASAVEVSLSYAALADLLGPVPESAFDGLPVPQRQAIDVALLRADSDGTPTERRVVATAFTSLVAALAVDGPVLVAIDDAQWLDVATARVLEFSLRRLERHRVAVVTTRRTASRAGSSPRLGRGFAGASEARFRRCLVGPLTMAEVHAVLKERFGRPLPDHCWRGSTSSRGGTRSTPSRSPWRSRPTPLEGAAASRFHRTISAGSSHFESGASPGRRATRCSWRPRSRARPPHSSR